MKYHNLKIGDVVVIGSPEDMTYDGALAIVVDTYRRTDIVECELRVPQRGRKTERRRLHFRARELSVVGHLEPEPELATLERAA